MTESTKLMNGHTAHNHGSDPVRKLASVPNGDSSFETRNARFKVGPARSISRESFSEHPNVEHPTLKSALHLHQAPSTRSIDALSPAHRTRFDDAVTVRIRAPSTLSTGPEGSFSTNEDEERPEVVLEEEEQQQQQPKMFTVGDNLLLKDEGDDERVDGAPQSMTPKIEEPKAAPEKPKQTSKQSQQQQQQQQRQQLTMGEILMSLQYQMELNKKEIRRNCMLFLLIACLFTGITVFAVLRPSPKGTYEMDLTNFAVFWPLERRLVLHHPKYPNMESFVISWGYMASPADGMLPSYCSNQDATPDMDCTDGDCCLNYPDRSNLRITAIPQDAEGTSKCDHCAGSAGTGDECKRCPGCVKVQWTYERDIKTRTWLEIEDDFADFADCFFTSSKSRKWYGGSILTSTTSWPRNWANMSFSPALTGDPENADQETDNHLGVMEPFWISNDGYAMFVDSPSLLYVNSTNNYFCIRSSNVMEYTVCEAENLKDLYGVLQGELLKSISKSQPLPNETAYLEKIEQVAGKIFVNLNVTSFDLGDPVATADQSDSLQFLWNNLPGTVAQNLILALEDTEVFNPELTRLSVSFLDTLRSNYSLSNLTVSVEINNFLDLESLQKNRSFWDKLIWQRDQAGVQSTGLVLWRNELRPVIDVTRLNVSDWFIDYCQNEWELYRVANFVIAAGGSGELLPVSPYLNGSDEIEPNPNVYSQKFVETLNKLGKWSVSSVGYRTQLTPYFVDVPVRCANKRSVIPVALSLSLYGYSFMSVDLTDIHTANCSRDTAEFLLALGMFFPVLRVPMEFLRPNVSVNGTLQPSWGFSLFSLTMTVYETVRNEVILPYYEEAFKRHPSKPVIRPMWWEHASRLDFEGREVALNISNQFMIGPDLVVVAFFDIENAYIYLPAGAWFNPFDKRRVNSDGKTSINYVTNRDEPVTCFIKINGTASD